MLSKIGITIAALMNLALWSFLIGDNRAYRLVQNIYIGVAAAHTFVLAFRNTIVPNLWKPLTSGNYVLVIPLIMGIALYTRVHKKAAHISRIPLSFIVGVGSALAIRGNLFASLTVQIASVMAPLNSLNNILLVVGTVCTLLYFMFTFKPNRVWEGASRTGRYVMMVAFGAMFGNTVMARLSLLIGRLQFLWGDWLGIIK